MAAASVGAVLLGFGAIGITSGSVAAGIQSSIGSVVAGSWFSTMTSWGMTGVFTTCATAGSVTAGTGIATAILSKQEDSKEKEGKDKN